MTTLLVASTGGHLKQMHRLHRRLVGVEGPFRWITFDTPQSRSLLEDEEHQFVPFVGSRDLVNVMRNVPMASQILRDDDVSAVVSTGAAVALPFFLLARAHGVRCHYIESAARSEGPSRTARMIKRIPGVGLYTQYQTWSDDNWQFRGAVFDAFDWTDQSRVEACDLQKVVVTLGTQTYGFRRLVQRLLEILPPDADVLWQVGDTDVSDMDIDGHRAIPASELNQAISEADLVVAHAGVGTALVALEAGRCPVLVPRRVANGEHVDDHQTQIASELAGRGLAISAEADELCLDHLLTAASRVVTTGAADQPFVLDAV